MILYSIISPPSVASTPILITAQLFLDLPQWFVEISVREYIQKYKWERTSTFLAKNIVEDVRFTFITMVCFVHAVECS